eukprot:scaffold13974_cov36-Cyclotella_meneghiniana.AAC.2
MSRRLTEQVLLKRDSEPENFAAELPTASLRKKRSEQLRKVQPLSLSLFAAEPNTKTMPRINSRLSDVTVIVGTGENKREFNCYKSILALASPVLDAMLDIDMIESQIQVIRFPDKDPDEFEMVLQCIDPANVSLFDLHDIFIEPEYSPEYSDWFNLSNVVILVPWFSELQMWRYLYRCEAILFYEQTTIPFAETDSFCLRRDTIFNIPKTILNTMLCLDYRNTCGGLGDSESFNLALIEQLVEVFLPLTPLSDDDGGTSYEATNGRYLWNRMVPWLDISALPLDAVNDVTGFSSS